MNLNRFTTPQNPFGHTLIDVIYSVIFSAWSLFKLIHSTSCPDQIGALRLRAASLRRTSLKSIAFSPKSSGISNSFLSSSGTQSFLLISSKIFLDASLSYSVFLFSSLNLAKVFSKPQRSKSCFKSCVLRLRNMTLFVNGSAVYPSFASPPSSSSSYSSWKAP